MTTDPYRALVGAYEAMTGAIAAALALTQDDFTLSAPTAPPVDAPQPATPSERCGFWHDDMLCIAHAGHDDIPAWRRHGPWERAFQPEAEQPTPEDNPSRLHLAHQARRQREHQLADIRRALCDTGLMRDDDPYSSADLADVIRQSARGEQQRGRVNRAVAMGDLRAAREAIARVRALHHEAPYVPGCCAHCTDIDAVELPCATLEALDGQATDQPKGH